MDSKLPKYDLNDLRELSNGSEDFFNEMIETFINSVTEGIEKIKSDTSQKNWDAIADTTHKILGPVKHISAQPLKSILKSIEDSAQNKSNVDEIPALTEEAEEVSKQIINLLKKESL